MFDRQSKGDEFELCMLFVTDKYDSLLRYLIGLKAVFSDNLSILSKISVEKFAQ